MSHFKFSYQGCLSFFSKITLFIFFLTSLGALELFKDGGARYQGVRQDTYDGWLQSVNDIYFFLVIICFCLSVKVYNKWLNAFFSIRSLASIFFYPLFLGLFLFFANFDFSVDILKSTILFSSSMLFCFIVSVSLKEVDFFSFLNKLSFLVLFFSLILIVCVPSYGVQIDDRAAWQGIFSHKNHLGMFCVLVAIFFGFKDKRMILPCVNYIMAFVLILGSRSYTSIVCFGLISFFHFIPRYIKYYFYKYRYQITVLFLLLSFFLVFVSIYGSQVKIFDKDISFSDRNLIWSYAFHKLFEVNFFGRGINHIIYENTFDVTAFYNATGQALTSFHNGFVNSIYEFGVFGFFLFFLIFLSLKENNTKYSFSFFIYSLVYVLINTFESIGIGFNFYFFLLMYFSLIQLKKNSYLG